MFSSPRTDVFERLQLPVLQCLKQSLGVLQIRRVKALGEPAVDGGEQIAGLVDLALFLPHAGQAGCGAQLQRLGAKGLSSSAADPDQTSRVSSGEVVEQRLRFLEVGRIEALGEPVVDGFEHVAYLGWLALATPQAGEARRRP